jgi:hypothetical protein
LHLGDLIDVDMAGRMDAARYGRIWEVAIRGARSVDTRGLAAQASEDRGGVVVRRYDRAPAIVVTDIVAQAAAAQTDGVAPTVELSEVGFAPHRCLQVIPQPGQATRITFSQLLLGTELVGYVGLADVFTRQDNRAPGHLDVELSGAIVASVTAGVDDGWARFAAGTRPGPADVTFVVHAEASDRHICFAAEARR